jgi:hypothetical protein
MSERKKEVAKTMLSRLIDFRRKSESARKPETMAYAESASRQSGSEDKSKQSAA